MKKIYFCGLSLLVASLGLAQGAVAATTTIVVGGCQITGVTGINHDYTNGVVTVNGGTLGSGCTSGGGGGGGSTTSYVSVTPASLSYTLGTTLSSPMAISWSSSDQGVTCSISNQTGLVTNPTAGNSWSLTTPTTAGTYNFPITCTSSTSAITSTVPSPSSVALTVSNAPPPPPPQSSGCSSSQLSTPWNLTRQCTGTLTYQYGAPVAGATFTSANPLQNLADVLGGGTWLNYAGESWAWVIPVNAGSYISMAFTPTASGILNLNGNATYGDLNYMSISTTPGVFDSTAVCVVGPSGYNNVAIGAGGNCTVTVGQTYYVNIADVYPSGAPHCAGGRTGCTYSNVSYTAN